MNRILATSLLLNLVLVVAIVAGAAFTGFFVQSNVLDPLYERQVSVYDAFPVAEGDVVFLGDTLVAAAPVEEMFPAHPVRNRGIVGDTSAGVLARLDQVLAPGPAGVVLMVGTFDVLAGVPRRDTVARVEEIVTRSAAADRPVLLLSVLPRDVEAVRSVDRLNEDFAALAARDGVEFLDLAGRVRADDGAIDSAYSNDGLHLNGDGYQLWREAIRPWLDGVVRARDAAAVMEATP